MGSNAALLESLVMAIVVEFLFYLVMEIVMHTIGRVVISVFLFGHARSESLTKMVSTTNLTDGNRNTYLVIAASTCQIIGVIVFTASLMLLVRFGS